MNYRPSSNPETPPSWFAAQMQAGESPMVSRTYVGARLQQVANGELTVEEAAEYIANYDPSLAAFGWKAAVEMARRARPNHLQYAVDKAVTWSASAEAAGYGAEAPRSAAAEAAVGKVSLTGAVISIADVTDRMTEDALQGATVVAGNVVPLRPFESEAWPPLDAA